MAVTASLKMLVCFHFVIKPLCFFSVKVQFSKEAAPLLPKILFVSEENGTALNTKLLKTSEPSSDSGKNPPKTNENTDGRGKPAKPDLCVLSLLIPYCCPSSTELWSLSGVLWGWNLMYILCKPVHRAAFGTGISCSVICVHQSCWSIRETMSVGGLQCLWGGVNNSVFFCLARRRLKGEFYGHEQLVEGRLEG